MLLSEPDTRVVVFCRPTKIAYYKERFKGYPNLVFESFVFELETTFIERILKFIGSNLLDTWDVYYLQRRRLMSIGKPFRYCAARVVSKILGNAKILRRLYRALDLRLNQRQVFGKYFEKYQPHVVFASDVLGVNDTIMLREAKKRCVFTIAMVRSWDNLTSKGVVRVQPDFLLVQTPRMFEEAVRLADMEPSHLEIVGVPSFDHYNGFVPDDPLLISKILSLSPGRPFILFSPLFEHYTESTVSILKYLETKINDGALPKELAVLVRYPPSYTSRKLDEFDGSKCIFFYQPGEHFPDTKTRFDWEFTKDDMRILANTIYHSKVTVNFVSTLTIESAVLDHPVVNIAFETMLHPSVNNSLRMLFKQQHIVPLLEIGGSKLAESYDELISHINSYLLDPTQDALGRKKIVEEYVPMFDGGTGRRIGKVILDRANKVPPRNV